MIGKKTFIFLAVIVAILFLGVAYAAIMSVTLNVTGNATATPDQANFKVYFTGTPTKVGAGTVTATIGSGNYPTTATLNVSGLTKVGDCVYAYFETKNGSQDIAAYLTSSVSNSNPKYFSVETWFEDSSGRPDDYINEGESVFIVVVVTLNKTLVTANQTAKITVSINAEPRQAS